MISVRHKSSITTLYQNEKAQFHVYPQEWQGNHIDFYFEDTRFNNSGCIKFQADTANLTIDTDKLYVNFNSEQDRDDYLLDIIKSFIKNYQFGYSPPTESLPEYDRDYHERNGYLNPNDFEASVKRIQATVIKQLADSKKALVAGCSSGMLLAELIALGIDAHGFDVINEIEKHALENVRSRVKTGSVQNVPYSATDGFDTYIALDVMEHIPERDVPQVVSEWVRLNVKKVVLLINHNEFLFEGHITLRPKSWWAAHFSKHFKLTKTFQFEKQVLYNNDNDSNHIWELWEIK